MIREFLQDFRASAARIKQELRAAFAAGQTTDAAAVSHKLKSSALAVGALTLGELCAAIEEEGKAGDSDALNVLLPRFEAEMTRVDQYLESLREQSPVNESTRDNSERVASAVRPVAIP
jgi:HPt (histidine-containing phosphotransfer) domain-containing protein